MVSISERFELSQTLESIPGIVYTIDPIHTFVTFRAQHLVVGRVRGRFGIVSGAIAIGKTPDELAVVAMIDSTSVTTLQAQRDEDLRSARFLDVMTFPTITYRSSAARVMPEGRWLVEGALPCAPLLAQFKWR
jgi:polyisoprenoid-binding protein YceI